MSILPEVSEKKAIIYDYFPTTWQAVIWRNWGYVPLDRIAKVLQTSCNIIRMEAERLGLHPEQTENNIWEQRGYLTLIRNNWHLCTYEQLLILLNVTEEMLAFILKEDDFMWIKLGSMKPHVDAPKYEPLTKEQEAQTREIAHLFTKLSLKVNEKYDNGFDFLKAFHVSLTKSECAGLKIQESTNLRMVYPYFALYGDTLIEEDLDSLPDKLLMEYAKAGVNGIWMQGVLYQLVEFPFDPTISKGWQIRLRSLRKLVEKAKRYGIGIYLYLNEPRSMPKEFFDKFPHLKGESEGDFYALCTSTKEVQQYLYQAVKKLFEAVPDLAGFFSITMSENLTNCYSRLFVHERDDANKGVCTCPRCAKRNPWEVVAEVNNLMSRGAHDASPNAKAISWTWGWPDEWAEKVVPLLTEGQIIQCTSEEALEFCIGGVKGTVLDYSMSLCGPGKKARNIWGVAQEQNLQTSAKVQINNTWEMAAVPYIPVFDKIAQHLQSLKELGVQHLHASWTLGGCPSPNYRLVAWLMDDKGSVEEFLKDWLGEEIGAGVNKAQKKLSEAFSHYPFHIDTLYFGPQNFAPMAPFFLERTDYEATMVGYPYDDLEKWSGIYPIHVYEAEHYMLCQEWGKGVQLLKVYEGVHAELDELILMAKTILCHYESTYHHIQFTRLREQKMSERDLPCKQELLEIVRAEMDTVEELISLRMKDSRVGYESSNHYFYTLQDLKEKMVNLAYCEKEIGRSMESSP